MYKRIYNMMIPAFILALHFMSTSCISNPEAASDTGNAETKKEESQNNEFRAIFDGSTLEGWEGDPAYWRVENGTIIGALTEENPLDANTFLIWREEMPSDFELKLDFRITESGNSGVNYRSEELTEPKFALKGYQADIDGKNTYTGQNYEERGRAFLAKRGEKSELKTGEKPAITGSVGDAEELKGNIKQNDWNTLRIMARGHHLQHYINGKLMSEITDNDPENRKAKGHLGFQVHKGPPMKVEYKNIYYKKLH